MNSLIERVNQTQLQEKDPDAEALLNKSLGPNPDALYILAQTVLVQNIALEQAKTQIAQLQQQAQQSQQAAQPARATSFLGSLLHRNPAPVPVPAQPGYEPVNPQYTQAPPQPGYPQYAPQGPQYGQPQFAAAPAGQPSFLSGAMQTAAGVAAGALAFEGVESILHGFGHPSYGWGGGFGGPGLMGGGFERPVEETVVNNYYDDPHAQGAEHEAGERHFHESADQGGAQFNDASYNTQGDDTGNYDNSTDLNADDGSNFDDSGNFDDGGNFDNGGGDVL